MLGIEDRSEENHLIDAIIAQIGIGYKFGTNEKHFFSKAQVMTIHMFP